MISEAVWNNYRNALAKVSRVTQKKVSQAWAAIVNSGIADDYALELLTEVLNMGIEGGGLLSERLAGELYQAMRQLYLPDEEYYALLPDMAQETANRVDKFMSEASASDVASVDGETVKRFVDSLVSMYPRRTMELNAHRDKACKGFQVVPSGLHTCSFCTMQAGRGIIYDHDLKNMRQPYHANCHCQPIPIFKGLPDWFNESHYSSIYHRAAEAYRSGNIPDDLRERIESEKAAKGKDYNDTNAIMAVMRYQNEGMK